MHNRRFAGMISVMLTMMLAVALVFAVPVGASSGSSSSSAAADTGVEVVSYKLEDNYQQPLNTINKGDSFWLRITLRDGRTPPASNPVLKLNSTSFKYYTAQNEVSPDPGTSTYSLHLVYTGTGNTFQADFIGTGPGNTAPVATVTLTLNQCVEYVAPDPSSSPATVGTGFVLKSATYGSSEVVAGEAFTLNASLMSTNGSNNVENATVTLVLPKEIKFQTGSSIYYVGTVAPNKTVAASFALMPLATAEEGSYTITIKMSGINPTDGSTVEASADITVPVVQPERFEIANARIPESLMVGMNDGSGYATLDLVNKGKGSVYNVEVEVLGEGLSTEEGKQFVGTIAGGAQNSTEFTLTADMGGQLEGKVVVSYENAKGEVKELVYEFTVMAEEMMIDPGFDPGIDVPVDPGAEGGGGMPIWVWALIVVLVLAGGVTALVIVRKKRKAKKDAELEADLYDDDDDMDFEGGTQKPQTPEDGQ